MNQQVENEKQLIRISSELKEIIPLFFDLTFKDINLAKQALDKAEFQEIKKIAHTLKGDSGGYGFAKLSELSSKLEDAAILKSDNKVNRWIKHIESYLGSLEIQYEER